jgi:hypothetical protein
MASFDIKSGLGRWASSTATNAALHSARGAKTDPISPGASAIFTAHVRPSFLLREVVAAQPSAVASTVNDLPDHHHHRRTDSSSLHNANNVTIKKVALVNQETIVELNKLSQQQYNAVDFPPGKYLLVAWAQVDASFGVSAQGDPSNVGPQSHLANIRANPAGWFASAGDRKVVGRKYWPSDIVEVVVSKDGSFAVQSVVENCAWWHRRPVAGRAYPLGHGGSSLLGGGTVGEQLWGLASRSSGVGSRGGPSSTSAAHDFNSTSTDDVWSGVIFPGSADSFDGTSATDLRHYHSSRRHVHVLSVVTAVIMLCLAFCVFSAYQYWKKLKTYATVANNKFVNMSSIRYR